MDSLSGISVFVLVAETRSFSEADACWGVAVGGGQERGAHGGTAEGAAVPPQHAAYRADAGRRDVPERCRRILCEVEAAELELSEASDAPRGKLRVSLPRYSGLFEPAIAEFMQRYPDVSLDLDFTDRMVDVIGDGYDAVVRTGEMDDSGLKRRRLGAFRRILVASPEYLRQHGEPRKAADLQRHACLHYRYPSTGRLERWPLKTAAEAQALNCR